MNKLFITLLVLLLISCKVESEKSAFEANMDGEKVWVFSQFNVISEADGMETYYYYGKVAKNMYEGISQNKLNQGFILLQEVKYWGEGDVIYEYKDGENSGELVFRIEDIYKIDLVNKEPVTGVGYEQFEEDQEADSME